MVVLKTMEYRRGDIVRVNLEPTRGREQQGASRPCVIIQNDIGNKNSDTTIIVPVTDARGKEVYPHQSFIPEGEGGLTKDSIAKCEQIRVIDSARISGNMGHLGQIVLASINQALRRSLEL
ncbi:MAG: type II toxin-antitoxin system PemK/MazF family toxin [Candidatus Marinimicrobia bacterium]|nr:type II toxin-antitoxin system PemK/MazF family toxin [Candidatus Neomarinimicrobiota bacterium]